MKSGTSTVPGTHTRPRSLRARSTSITCSARSFGSAEQALGQPDVLLLGRAARPGPGGRVHARPTLPVTVTSASGEEPTTSNGLSRPAKRSRYMYGDGLVARSTRYRSSASTSLASSNRWASTTWKASPARMCSRIRSTPSS